MPEPASPGRADRVHPQTDAAAPVVIKRTFMPAVAGSVLDQATDRDGGDVAGCRNGLCKSKTDIDQR